jgi:L-2-hydroxyglutarate oxidase
MAGGERFDVAVIGGGIVGLAVARELAPRFPALVVLEAERRVAAHQSGHNSGVIHSGLYYEPGSRKALDCAAGRERMYEYCAQNSIRHDRCGKLVVATSDGQLPALADLEQRGRANGLEGLRRLDAAGIREVEPHVRARSALWVPQTGIVDFSQVAETLATRLRERGVDVRLGRRVTKVRRSGEDLVVTHAGGELRAGRVINCGGLQADRIARACGLEPDLRIVPFKGEYFRLAPHREALVWNLVYPVPDARLPFLGVHLTRTIHGGVRAGPNALLAWSRAGYARWSFSARDAWSTLTWPGFWRLAARHWRTGAGEAWRSLSRRALARELRRMVPEISAADLERDGAGIRAQAVARDGRLIDDFRILESRGMVHVLNAPSPAATAAFAIAGRIAEVVRTWS